ncbi:MAG: hypothetical protein PVI07_16025, partial [Anaerolineae bacterium]
SVILRGFFPDEAGQAEAYALIRACAQEEVALLAPRHQVQCTALVKRYIAEPGSREVAWAIAAAEVVGTSLVSRADTAAALAKAVRVGTLTGREGASALQVFRSEWPNLVRVRATEVLVARADELAWELGPRGVRTRLMSIWIALYSIL